LTDFWTDYGIVVALGCAAAAVVYGLLVTQRLLAKSPGNERMQEISGAVQEGASAYLKRQYTIIAGVGVVVAILLIPLQNVETAIGFVIGHPLRGRRVHRHEPLGRERTRGWPGGGSRGNSARARHRLQGRLGHRAARRRPRPAGSGRILRRAADLHRLTDKDAVDALVRARFRWLADLRVCPARRWDLHQGGRRWTDLVGKIEAGIPEDDPATLP
jgi:K(+)-stimulated pyrophosphate-energized sodium pump